MLSAVYMPYTDHVLKWDYLKYKVRQYDKTFFIDKAKERRAKRNELELRVKSQGARASTLYKLARWLNNIMTVKTTLRIFTMT